MINITHLKLFSMPRQNRLNIPLLNFEGPGITALVGHNGAGKSSLLKLIAGFEKPQFGEVLYEGKNTFYSFEEIKKKIHLISWGISLYANMSGAEHLNLVKNLSSTWDSALEQQLLKDFIIPLGQKVEMLSRGEQAKLRLLLSLPCSPSVVLLDEVTNELDTDSRRSILKKLDLYTYETHAQVIVATNMIDDIERYATQVVVLKSGEVALSGQLDALKEEKKCSFEEMVRQYERLV